MRTGNQELHRCDRLDLLDQDDHSRLKHLHIDVPYRPRDYMYISRRNTDDHD